jgi:nicotinamidase/pyrazinamidase
MAGGLTPGVGDVLLVIDVQNDFCPGGGLAVPEGDRVVPVINRIAPAFGQVVLTQDWHPPGHQSFASSHPGRQPFETIEVAYGPQTLWPDHCVQGTPGAEFHADLETTRAELIIRKGYRTEIDSYSAFFENDHETATGLSGYLRDRGLGRAFICGLATDYCVAFSAIDAAKGGLDVLVIEDACGAIDLDGSMITAKATMSQAGVRFIDSSALGA